MSERKCELWVPWDTVPFIQCAREDGHEPDAYCGGRDADPERQRFYARRIAAMLRGIYEDVPRYTQDSTT